MLWANEPENNMPLKFEFGGAKYELESGIFDKSGKLAKEEIIVREMN